MTAFSPLAAALEGARVIRREPMAVLSWVGLWLVALIAVGAIVVFTAPHLASPRPAGGGVLTLAHRFGPFWPALISTLLILWIMTTATVFRAVLRPDEHGWHLLKLGADEARLAVITVIGAVIVLALGSGPAFLVWLLTQPLLLVIPEAGQGVVIGGTIATVCLQVWIAVRLSLAPVYTFDTHRYHLVSYWDITQTHFWRLCLSYLLVAVQMAGIFLMFFLVTNGLRTVASSFLLQVEIVSDLLAAVVFVLVWTIYCACQAAAYKAIMLNPPPAFHPTPPRRKIP